MSPVESVFIGGLFAAGCGYALLGVLTYVAFNGGSLSALPAWYVGSARGPREKVLLALWFPAVVALWPLVLPPWLVSRFGFRVCERLGAMSRRARGRGRRLCGGGGGVDMESGGEASLDERRRRRRHRWGTDAGPVTLGVFVDPFDGDRGRSGSRAGRPEVSENRSPMDRGADGSRPEGPEQQRTTWYSKLPSPAEMQRARAQTSPGGSSSSSSPGRSPGTENGNGDGGLDDDEEDGCAPVAGTEALRRLQTIPEDEGCGLGGGREDVR
ncbi:hypothetical protein LX32DRAFT_729692 [Colletotrichum zoysiae]|uniref:Uncharacterized protein n=1 Tax=Colletotrichum zoysiae TaxID=1216348 RepID=A0AAD9HDU3_9PEZI|nr:hypothetical protein LX32DRAFT_729692 [Colletotrichum zoysiae]